MLVLLDEVNHLIYGGCVLFEEFCKCTALILGWFLYYSDRPTLSPPRLRFVHCLDLQGSTDRFIERFWTRFSDLHPYFPVFQRVDKLILRKAVLQIRNRLGYALPTSRRSEPARSGSFSSPSRRLARNSALWSSIRSFGTNFSRSALFKPV